MVFTMTNPSYVTFTVRNLPLGTTEQDVQNHINSLVRMARPLVGTIIQESTRPLCYTTVTIRQDSDKDWKEKLKGSVIYPVASLGGSQINVSQEFLGVTTLVEHEDALFDFYFVHGLGGHAFKTWSPDNDKAAPPQMWPRDFLPNDVKGQPVDPNNPDGPKLRGRFSTIGYQANARNTWSATTTIESVAENFLIQIKTDRPEGSTRPMYFACHSLGGLVLCQALIQALHDDGGDLGLREDYKHIFYQNDECLVKGIFFFGTPFSGSNLAKYASLIVKAMNGNSTLINSLRDHAEGLSAILGKFNQLRYHPATTIPILIAYEKKPMYGYKFVTQPDSAMASGSFRSVPPMGIDGDHRTMVKFESPQDQDYRVLSVLIIRMIQSTLAGPEPASLAVSHVSQVDNKAPEAFTPRPLPRAATTSSITTLPPPYRSPSTYRISRPPALATHSEGGVVAGPDHVEHYDQYSWTRRDSKLQDAQMGLPVSPNNLPISRLSIIGTNNGQGPPNPENTSAFNQLAQFDIVFLVDDTGSMITQDCDGGKSRWTELIQSMRHIVDLVCHYDKDGVDVHFLINSLKDEPEIREGQRVMTLLTKEVGPDEMGGGTYMQDQLWEILTRSIDKFEEYRRAMKSGVRAERAKKLNLIVITDGAADDKEEVEFTITSAAQRLDQLQAPPNQVGIQFLQIGRDVQAGKWLEFLDDSLHKMQGIRDIVDTRPWNNPEVVNQSFTKRLEQILLGAVSRLKDGEETVELRS